MGCLAAIATVVSACGNDDMAMMSDYAADMDRHVEALRTEQSTHSAEIAAAQDVDGVDRAEIAHRQRNDGQMRKMNMVMGEMMSCTDGRGSPFDHGSLSEVMQGMWDDCDKHRDNMRNLPDLETRRVEETRHQDTMKNLLDQMQGQMRSMMGTGGMYSCNHCTHCGV
jgi:hypothetical protein